MLSLMLRSIATHNENQKFRCTGFLRSRRFQATVFDTRHLRGNKDDETGHSGTTWV